MRKILITGAQGFIGFKLGQYFYHCGDTVEGWDLTAGSHEYFTVKKVNMEDEAEVLSGLSACQPDIVIHCAGNADVGKSVQYPALDFHGNVTLTHNLLFGLHKLEMTNTRFVFLSSAGVYGNPEKLPITEDMALQPLSPYALHKVMCEDMCRYFIQNYGQDVKIARIFSAYGRGLKKQIFWDMYQKQKKTGRLDMFGTGGESRDYIHIDDVVQALYLLSTADTDDVIFNVANGEEITIRTATDYFARCAGVGEENIAFNGVVREGDPLNWRADISRIKGLGYEKKVELDDGLRDYYAWIREQ